jgi:hypothetical protein
MSDPDFDDSFDLTRLPTAPRLLSDSSQLSGVGSLSVASYPESDPNADLSLAELSLDPTPRRPPKFSLLPPKQARVHDDSLAEQRELIEEEDSLIDETVRIDAEEEENVDEESRERNAQRARDDALQQELFNIRRVNETLRNYHAVLQETLAGRQVCFSNYSVESYSEEQCLAIRSNSRRNECPS